MSNLIILTADGSQTPYDESEVHALLGQGVLSPDAHYWREGMTEWRPLHELVPAAVIPPPPAVPLRQTSSSNFHFTKDPSGLTRFLTVLLLINVAIAAASLLSDTVVLILAQGSVMTDTLSFLKDGVAALLGLLDVLVYLVTAFTFLKWIYRANLNCRGFGAQHLEYTPKWCIGAYFVPVACLVWPYQSMREIWYASSDPLYRGTDESCRLLGFWWAFWLISCIAGQITLRMHLHMDDSDLGSLRILSTADILDDIACIGAGIFAYLVIKTIYDKQQQLTAGLIPQAG